MFSIQHFGLFALSVLLINITPGATFLAVSSASITKGLRAGLYTAAGACCGLLSYALLCWLGLAAVITQSKTVFLFIKYAGVVYLLYCGIKAFLQTPFQMPALAKPVYTESFKRGLFVNLLNPLTAVSFLTLVPQFINPAAEPSAQILFMGLWISFSALTVNVFFATLFSFSGKYLSDRPAFWRWQGRITGVLFLYLALTFAFK